MGYGSADQKGSRTVWRTWILLVMEKCHFYQVAKWYHQSTIFFILYTVKMLYIPCLASGKTHARTKKYVVEQESISRSKRYKNCLKNKNSLINLEMPFSPSCKMISSIYCIFYTLKMLCSAYLASGKSHTNQRMRGGIGKHKQINEGSRIVWRKIIPLEMEKCHFYKVAKWYHRSTIFFTQ